MRVLVHLPNPVGDAVMATSFLRSLKAGNPNDEIFVALRPKLKLILEGTPSVDEYILMPRGGSLTESLRLGIKWRGVFDRAFILPNSFRSVLFPWLAGARERIGYAGQGRTPLLTRAIAKPLDPARRRRLPEPMPHYWRRLLEATGAAWLGDRPELVVTEELEDRARRRARALGIEEDEKLVGLSPGASFGPSKVWPPERFAETAAILYRDLSLRAILFLAPGEEELGRRVLSAARSPVISTLEDPLPLDLLKAFVRRCRLLVTCDSGTRHFGVAFSVPTVTVMGPTDPRYTAYCLDTQEVVIRDDLDCIGCHLRRCPKDHACMNGIAAEEVAQRALKLLARLAREGK